MAPKVEKSKEKDKPQKVKKRGSSDEERKGRPGELLSDAATELLSPSEMVKMRKKSRLPSDEGRDGQETRSKDDAAKKVKATRTKDSETKPQVTEDRNDKDGSKLKERKERPPKGEQGKRPRVDKEKQRRLGASRKKAKSSDALDAAHVLFPCGICTKEVNDEDEAILCEAGCGFWYHRSCTGMSDFAYVSLTNEENAEWVCDKCIATKSIPLVKLKSFEMVAL